MENKKKIALTDEMISKIPRSIYRFYRDLFSCRWHSIARRAADDLWRRWRPRWSPVAGSREMGESGNQQRPAVYFV